MVTNVAALRYLSADVQKMASGAGLIANSFSKLVEVIKVGDSVLNSGAWKRTFDRATGTDIPSARVMAKSALNFQDSYTSAIRVVENSLQNLVQKASRHNIAALAVQNLRDELDALNRLANLPLDQFVEVADVKAMGAAFQSIKDSILEIDNQDVGRRLTAEIASLTALEVQATNAINKTMVRSKAYWVKEYEKRIKEAFKVELSGLEVVGSSVFSTLWLKVERETAAIQKGLETFSSSIISRSELVTAAIRASFMGGGPIDTSVKALTTLGQLNYKAGSDELLRGAAHATKMAEALGISGDSAARLVFYGEKAGMTLEALGDTMASIRDNTRLTAEEFGNFTKEISQALLVMGKLGDYAETLKSTLRIDDALRKFTGQSGDYTNFFKNLATSGGMQSAMMFGLNPETMGQEAEQQRFIENLGKFVDNLITGQPLLQQTAVLESLSAQTNLSVVALRNMAKAAAALNSTVYESISLDKRYANEVSNLNKSLTVISNSLSAILYAGMYPFVAAVNWVAQGVAHLLEKARAIPAVFETLAVVAFGGVTIAAFGLISASLKVAAAAWAGWAGLKALNAELLKTSLLAPAAAAAQGAAASGPFSAAGKLISATLVRPFAGLTKVLSPLASLLPAFLTIAASVAAIVTTVSLLLYKETPVAMLRKTMALNEDNERARKEDVARMQAMAQERYSKTTGAMLGDAFNPGASPETQLRNILIKQGGRTVSFGSILDEAASRIYNLQHPTGGEMPITDQVAVALSREMAERNSALLRHAVGTEVVSALTTSQRRTPEDNRELELLERSAVSMDQQVSLYKAMARDNELRVEQEAIDKLINLFRIP